MSAELLAQSEADAGAQIARWIKECKEGASDREADAVSLAGLWGLDVDEVCKGFAFARNFRELRPAPKLVVVEPARRAEPERIKRRRLDEPRVVVTRLPPKAEAEPKAVPLFSSETQPREDQGKAEQPEVVPRLTSTATGMASVLNRFAPRDNAIQFAETHCKTDGVLTTWHWDDRFWRWNSCFYEPIGDKQIEDEVWAFLDKAKLGDGSRFVPRTAHVAELIRALKSAVSIDPKTNPPAWIGEDFPDRDARDMLAFQNTLFDCRAGDVLPLTPALWIHDGAGYDYDPDGRCPRWERFLEEIFDDQASRDALEEMLGYCMTYDTKFEKGFVLVGVKRSGKSTVAAVLRRLIGDKAYIGMSFSTMRGENSIQDVVDRKVVVFSDARFRQERKFYNSRDPGGIDPNVAEFLLNVIGRDTISLGRKYKSRWMGQLAVKIVITSNETPNLQDSTGVLPTRFIKLSFDKSFFGKEDIDLRDRLFAEAPGIANRCLAALRQLNERGRFIQPDAGKPLERAIEELVDPLAKFCHECLDIDPAGPGMTNAAIYTVFEMWCGRTNNQWLVRSIPHNQLIGKIRKIEGYETVAMSRPHDGKRVYSLKKRPRETGEASGA